MNKSTKVGIPFQSHSIFRIWALPRSRILILILLPLLVATSCNQQQSESNNLVKSSQVFMPSTNSALTPSSEDRSAKYPTTNNPLLATIDPTQLELENALKEVDADNYSGALTKVNAIIQANPQNKFAYSIRGNIYTKMKDWDKAKRDFDTILELDSKNTTARFNLFELKFMQKDYAGARPGFASLESDPDWGDLASYKVFLSDLFSGQDALARRELDNFDKIATRPSYYFGNAAWLLYHDRPDDARSWLESAVRIYTPKKVYLYTFSLQDLGYLPLQGK